MNKEIDFKDIASRIESCKYLDTLIDNFIKTNTLHLSLVESKKHVDYTFMYLSNIYPRIQSDANKLYNILLKNSYNGTRDIEKELLVVDEYINLSKMYDITILFTYLLMPIKIYIKYPTLHMKKNTIKGIDSLSLELYRIFGNHINGINFIKKEITNILNNIDEYQLSFTGDDFKFRQLFSRGEVYDDKLKKKFNDLVTLLQKATYNIIVEEI